LSNDASGKIWMGLVAIMIGASLAACSMNTKPWKLDEKVIAHGGTPYTVNSLVFSPNGETLVSGDNNNQVSVWNAQTGELLRTLNATDTKMPPPRWEIRAGESIIGAVYVSPDGTIVVNAPRDGNHRMLMWDIQKGELLHTLTGHENWIWTVAFSPDSKILASGGAHVGILLWDIQTGKTLGILEQPAPLRSLVFSPDGKLLAAGSFTDLSTMQIDGSIYLWDVQTRELLNTLRGHEASTECLVFSPDGKILASGSSDGTMRLWDIQTGRQLKALTEIGGPVASISFSPNGKTMASGGWDGNVRLWDVESGVVLKKMRTFGNWSSRRQMVSSVSFSPDGGILAVGTEDGATQFWNLETGKKLKVSHSLGGPLNKQSPSP